MNIGKPALRGIWLITWIVVLSVLLVLFIKDRTGAWPQQLQQFLPNSDETKSSSNSESTVAPKQAYPATASPIIIEALNEIRSVQRLPLLKSNTDLMSVVVNILAELERSPVSQLTEERLQNLVKTTQLADEGVESIIITTAPSDNVVETIHADARIQELVGQFKWRQVAAAGQVMNINGTPIQYIVIVLASGAAATPPATAAARLTPLALPYMSNSDIFQELNAYRAAHQVPQLVENQQLCQYAEKRVGDLLAHGGLDNHAGFIADTADLTNLPESLKNYSGGGIGENLAFQNCRNMTTGDSFIASTSQQLIEWCFDSSTKGHREAQLNPRFTAACIRQSQGYFVVIFGE